VRGPTADCKPPASLTRVSYYNAAVSAEQLSHAEFRRALSQFATGVTVISTRDGAGNAVGVTANSFSSLSLDPPLVLWSLARSARSLDAFRACRGFVVQVLGAGQLDVARSFATRAADKFAMNGWRDTAQGLPRLDGCVAWFECTHRSQYDEGDHVILVGRVTRFEVGDGTPLIFHGGRYLTDLTEAPLPRELRSANL
jgi:flavin reductase (DIM6/NTAB) family NADH-FMN oxidoreductase RutF